jgi:hypothetical protein
LGNEAFSIGNEACTILGRRPTGVKASADGEENPTGKRINVLCTPLPMPLAKDDR